MASKIRMADGHEFTIALSGKRVAEAFAGSTTKQVTFTQFTTATKSKIWVSMAHVAAIVDRPDLD
jgi:hypothetical protein